MPKIILHSIAGSPPCRTILMLNELLGLDMDIKYVNTIAGDQFKPDFLAKNPLHTVPLLEDGDFVLADSHAIATYLVSKYGAEFRAELYPADFSERATIDQRLYFETSVLFPTFRAVMTAIFKDNLTTLTPEFKEKFEEAYGYLEKYLERSKFVAADHITVADLCIVATISTMNLMLPVSSDKFPKILEWMAKLETYSWYEKGNKPGLEMIGGFLKTKLENNP